GRRSLERHRSSRHQARQHLRDRAWPGKDSRLRADKTVSQAVQSNRTSRSFELSNRNSGFPPLLATIAPQKRKPPTYFPYLQVPLSSVFATMAPAIFGRNRAFVRCGAEK